MLLLIEPHCNHLLYSDLQLFTINIHFIFNIALNWVTHFSPTWRSRRPVDKFDTWTGPKCRSIWTYWRYFDFIVYKICANLWDFHNFVIYFFVCLCILYASGILHTAWFLRFECCLFQFERKEKTSQIMHFLE